MSPEEEAFNRKKVCYEQNFQQARSLNDQMNRIPTIAITLTGGLWYGASLIQTVDTHIRFGLLLLAGVCDLALVMASIRIRDVLQSYFEKIEQFDPESYASGRPSKPKLGALGNYSMINLYCCLMITVALMSFVGGIAFYWPFSVPHIWGVVLLATALMVAFRTVVRPSAVSESPP